MVLYLPVKEQLHQDELGDYISYGIAAWKLPALTRKPCAFVSDVTLDKKQGKKVETDPEKIGCAGCPNSKNCHGEGGCE